MGLGGEMICEKCGNDDLVISIYEHSTNKCLKCKRIYQLIQINRVYELNNTEGRK